MELVIDTDGMIATIYDDDARDLYDVLGEVAIERASHVEPDDAGRWLATMADGRILGPYRLRADALAAEVEYIRERLL